jgi:hypothetical protein
MTLFVYHGIVRSTTLALLLVVLLSLLLAHALPAEAGGNVSNCTDAGLTTALGGGGSVTFSCGPATITLDSTKQIIQNTTIDGGNIITLSGGTANRLFVVNSGATLTLTNITVRDGYASSGDGGAIFVANGGALTVQSGRFYSNTTTSSAGGGAITSYGALMIRGSEFAYNKAGGGGALNNVYGGAVTVISTSTFHHNAALSGNGGAIYLRDAAPLTLTNVSLMTNTAQNLGGAVFALGGSSVTAIGSQIRGNTSRWDGGGIYSERTLTVLSSTIAYNHADNHGGGLFANGTTTLISTTLSGNSGYSGGGALYTQNGMVTLDRSTLSQNSSTNFSVASSPQPGAAIMAYTGTDLLVNNSLLEHNDYASSGGAIWSIGAVTVRDSVLRNNSAYYDGGALTAGGVVTIVNSQIDNNFAVGDPGIGGGLYIGIFVGTFGRITGTATISGSLVKNNLANGLGGIGGGGIYNEGALTVTQTTLHNNFGNPYGGGLYNRGTATLNAVTLSANRAVTTGGGIYNQMTLYGSQITVTDNAASLSGGGMYNYPQLDSNPSMGLAWLTNLTLSGNHADVEGGGIMNDGWLLIEKAMLSTNSADFGAAIENRMGTVDLDRTALVANAASGFGGGIVNRRRADFSNVTFSGNSAALEGGGMLNEGSALLQNVTLSNNDAPFLGGALSLRTGSYLTLTNTIVANSVSGGNCGGTGSIVSKYSISSDATCALTGPGDRINLDPKLTALGDYGGSTLVHMPKADSLAINGVVGSDAPPVDQRGLPRPVGGAFDIGAVERQPTDVDAIPRLWLPLLVR